MLTVQRDFRNKGIATKLVCDSVGAMIAQGAQDIVLETEASNAAALGFYEKLGFVRCKLLPRYYMNGGDAFRLKLWIDPPSNAVIPSAPAEEPVETSSEPEAVKA
jgi:peptide alpha-N-acetyltransferase